MEKKNLETIAKGLIIIGVLILFIGIATYMTIPPDTFKLTGTVGKFETHIVSHAAERSRARLIILAGAILGIIGYYLNEKVKKSESDN